MAAHVDAGSLRLEIKKSPSRAVWPEDNQPRAEEAATADALPMLPVPTAVWTPQPAPTMAHVGSQPGTSGTARQPGQHRRGSPPSGVVGRLSEECARQLQVLEETNAEAQQHHQELMEEPTTLLLYPTLTLKLNQHPLLGEFDTSSLTKLLVAGGTVTGHLLQSITKKLNLKGIIQVYGMTELTGAIALSTPNLNDVKSVGKPAAFMEMKVVDPVTRESLGPLQLGEICVRGPSAFKGYAGRPEETAAIYEDGFVMTGDTGYYSADGLFYVSGRIKELIKCMDQQVAPAELEELLAADPGVRQVVVAGVPHPQLGEAALAFVVPSQRLQGPSEEQQEAKRLKELVGVNLAIHKHLHGGVEFLERIPHTESGKDLRRALKDAYLEQHGGN